MLKKLCWEIQIHIELPTSHRCILRPNVLCYLFQVFFIMRFETLMNTRHVLNFGSLWMNTITIWHFQGEKHIELVSLFIVILHSFLSRLITTSSYCSNHLSSFYISLRDKHKETKELHFNTAKEKKWNFYFKTKQIGSDYSTLMKFTMEKNDDKQEF